MDANSVLSMLSSDKPGIYPSQKYFSQRRNYSSQEDLFLFAWLIDSNQIKEKGLLSIFEIMCSKKEVTYGQIKWVLNAVKATYCRNLSSATDLYKYPSLEQINAIKEKYSYLKELRFKKSHPL